MSGSRSVEFRKEDVTVAVCVMTTSVMITANGMSCRRWSNVGSASRGSPAGPEDSDAATLEIEGQHSESCQRDAYQRAGMGAYPFCQKRDRENPESVCLLHFLVRYRRRIDKRKQGFSEFLKFRESLQLILFYVV
jgi:hypothetical protein